MANFNTLSELLNTTDGMTVKRDNVKNDDSVDTLTGAEWFKFNNIAASNIYIHGDSYFGFGASAQHLKTCYRDGAVLYEWEQFGTISNYYNFAKYRWRGYTRYNYTSDQYLLEYEVFLIDTGVIYLNIITAPTSASYLGTSQLVCGSNTYSFTVTAGTPVVYYFMPQDANGTAFVLYTGSYEPPPYPRYSQGTCILMIDDLSEINQAINSYIEWEETNTENTNCVVSAALTDGSEPEPEDYTECINKSEIPVIISGADISDKTLYIKVDLSTSNIYETPLFGGLIIKVQDKISAKIIRLTMDDLTKINNFIGEVSVVYDKFKGNLRGRGGTVESFTSLFLPEDLFNKPNQNDQENIEISNITATGNLIKVYYTETKAEENISIADITATGVLTYINDL